MLLTNNCQIQVNQGFPKKWYSRLKICKSVKVRSKANLQQPKTLLHNIRSIKRQKLGTKGVVWQMSTLTLGRFICQLLSTIAMSQQAKAVFHKISGSRNKNHPGMICMCQGFQKCIARNPSKQAMGGLCWIALPILPNFGELARIGRATLHGPSMPYLLGFHAMYFWNP